MENNKFCEISVIIPVYNTEKYLAETLDSVLVQTFQNFEIICINDGSSDNSQEILNEYAKKDSRIKIINQKNSGVVVARNNGIKNAYGKYIYPLDSDDIIAPNCLEVLHRVISTTKNRVVASEVECFNSERYVFFKQPKFNKYEMYGWHECCVISALFYKSDWEKYGGYSELFNGNSGDDMDFWLNYIDNNEKMCRVPDILFYYREKPVNESVWKNYSESEFNDRMQIKMNYLLSRHKKMKFWINIWDVIHSEFFKRYIYYNDYNPKVKHTVKVFGIRVYKRNYSINLFYFNEISNFGDILNKTIPSVIFKKNAIFVPIKKARAIFIGSIMEKILYDRKFKFIKKIKELLRPKIHIWGTGFIIPENNNKYINRRISVHALRGKISLARLQKITGKKYKNVVLGDPGLLSSHLVDSNKIKKKYALGIIPHYVDEQNPLLKKIKINNSVTIDIKQGPIDVLKQMAECEFIISSAMHGLIAADSLGIPNIRMILSDKIVGGDYKFNDYYSVFNIDNHQKIDLNKSEFTESDLQKSKENYKISPDQVKKICDDLIKVFPFK